MKLPRRYLILGALAVALVAVVGPRAFAQDAPSEDGSGFVDTEGNIHEEDIRYIVERGLTLGCDLDGPRYCPDQPVSRAEMATFLTRALRLDTTVPYLGVYADIGEGIWYTRYVEAVGAYGLTDTRVSGNYRPTDPMLRSEMAIFLQKAFRLSSTHDASTSSFQDIPADAPYAAAAEAILEAGITRGCGLDPLLYCPDDTVRRDTMAAFLARALRGAEVRRVLDLAPGREVLSRISTGSKTWDVWVCEDAPVQEDLTVYLNREITPYFRWLSGGKYTPRFRYGRNPSPDVTTVLENCENESAFSNIRPSGANIFVGGDLWDVDVRAAGLAAIRVDPEVQRQNAWMDKRSMYLTTAYAHEIGHTFGWPHQLKEEGAPASEPLTTNMDVMSTQGPMVGTHAHNLFQMGWIDPQQVAVHPEGAATYGLSLPHSKGDTQLLMIPLSATRLISVGVRSMRSYDREIPAAGVELNEISLCDWWPGCKRVYLPPGAQSIHPVVLGVGDSWTARVPAITDGRHWETHIKVSVTDRRSGTYKVQVEQTVLEEDGYSVIDVGEPGVCGIRFSGSVHCRGWGGVEDVPEGSFTSVGLGYLACGIRATDAGMECWGLSYDGTPPPKGAFSSVSVMGEHACGLRVDGTVACLGLYRDSKPAVQPPDGTFISVSAGLSHACGMRADHTVECWGRNERGADLSTPPAGEFASISSGGFYSCGLRPDKGVTCWSTQEGQGTWQPPPGQYKFVASGWYNNCAISINGGVVCWGHDQWFDFTPPDGVFTAVSVEYDRACGLRLNHTVECWGSQRGQ